MFLFVYIVSKEPPTKITAISTHSARQLLVSTYGFLCIGYVWWFWFEDLIV